MSMYSAPAGQHQASLLEVSLPQDRVLGSIRRVASGTGSVHKWGKKPMDNCAWLVVGPPL